MAEDVFMNNPRHLDLAKKFFFAIPRGFSDWDRYYHYCCAFVLRGVCKRGRNPMIRDVLLKIIGLHVAMNRDPSLWGYAYAEAVESLDRIGEMVGDLTVYDDRDGRKLLAMYETVDAAQYSTMPPSSDAIRYVMRAAAYSHTADCGMWNDKRGMERAYGVIGSDLTDLLCRWKQIKNIWKK